MFYLCMTLVSNVPGVLHTVRRWCIGNGYDSATARHNRYVAKQQTITVQVTHLCNCITIIIIIVITIIIIISSVEAYMQTCPWHASKVQLISIINVIGISVRKEVYLYSAILASQSAQTWITQFYLQITPRLPFLRKRSPDVATTTEVADN